MQDWLHGLRFLLNEVFVLSGLLLLINFKSYDDNEKSYKQIPIFVSILIGGVLGFISGIVGIGGGIFLSPILFLIRAGKPKHIVTTASLFILKIGRASCRERV